MEDYHDLVLKLANIYKKKNLVNINYEKIITEIISIINNIKKLISEFFATNYSSFKFSDSSNIQVIIIIAIITCFISLFIYYLLAILKYRKKSIVSNNQSDINITSLINSVYWQNKSEVFIQENNYTEATKSLYFACLSLMVENNIIKYDYNKTNYEIGKALFKHQQLKENFLIIAKTFEKAFFGEYQLKIEDYYTVKDSYEFCKDYIQKTGITNEK